MKRSIPVAAVAILALVSTLATTVSAAGKWTVQTSPNPAGADRSFLYDVSCTSANACTAVGYASKGSTATTLVERWNGAKWTIQRSPNPSALNALVAVSCPSASSCMAVGYAIDGSGTRIPLAERWNGSRWSSKPLPVVAGATWTTLQDVSCASPSACLAVGYYADASSWNHAFAMRWNGSRWSSMPALSPPGADQSYLNGVSCASPTACQAVGYTEETIDDFALVASWNGLGWSFPAVPNQGDEDNHLHGVSCTAATSCMAVGRAGSAALSWRLKGSTWKIFSTPSVSGASLGAVSCTAARACTAVGQSSAGTLAERWNGAAWSVQTTPNPAGTSALYGVSCPAATTCTAVGIASYSTLVERWKAGG